MLFRPGLEDRGIEELFNELFYVASCRRSISAELSVSGKDNPEALVSRLRPRLPPASRRRATT